MMSRKKIWMFAVAGGLVLAVAVGVARRPATAATAPAAEAASALTVALTAVDTRTWSRTVRITGPVTAWEEIVIGPEVAGLRVTALAVDVGQRVARGQVMARLADETVRAELAKQEAVVAQAKASLQQATGDLTRARSVSLAGALAPQKLDEYVATEATSRASLASAEADLKSARVKLAQTRIVAPEAGVVASKTGVVGNVASTSSELYRLIRDGRLEWQAELDAQQIQSVKAGQAARVVLPNGLALTGRVRLVSPTLSTTTGRGIAYVSLPADGPARAGMFANGTIELGQQPAATVPEAAVVVRDGRSYVYTVAEDGRATSRAVTTGRRQDGRVEVVSGLSSGARVVASGGAFLSDGARVTVLAAADAPTTTGSAR